MSQKCDRGVDPEFCSDPELMSTDPLTMKGFEASADVSWPMNHVANQVSAGPSAMEVMADHWLKRSARNLVSSTEKRHGELQCTSETTHPQATRYHIHNGICLPQLIIHIEWPE